ncbi:MAG: HAMP domain-containing histidine kinase [Lachnospiraceae bacterium]|nr:HAMP domain-containing histidine kinase [Lachnospiraceae bacterium]
MFHRSERKIVITVMFVLVLFLAVTLATIYGSSYMSLQKQNREMLKRYVDMYSLDALPGSAPPSLPPGTGNMAPVLPDGSAYKLSSFYSAAVSSDGTILAADTGSNGIYQESDIVSMAREILAGGKNAGKHGKLLYKVDEREDYTLVAFMDVTLTDSSMRTLLLNTLIAGLISICVFLAVSVMLAKSIIRPLAENDRKQKQFISDAGHELKTPVSVISANAELLSRQIGENQWLANIRYENERMGNLVKNLLELSHAENSPAVTEEIDLSRLVEQEVLPFEGIAFERGMTIQTQLEENIMIRGNRAGLEQLVSILVDNAVSHSSGGTQINVELKREHRGVLLQVKNPGEEIPEQIRDKLFDRFYRMDEARGENGGHFGLGLSIARAVTESHKGKIRISCRDGMVIVSVMLPADHSI